MNTVVSLRIPGAKRSADQPQETMWPIEGLVGSDASDWVNAAVDESESRHTARALFAQLPNLRQTTNRFAAMIGPRWPTSDGSKLLNVTIEKAVSNVQKAFERGETFEGRAIGVYLYWLQESVEEIAKVELYGVTRASKAIKWRYFSEEIQAWVQRNGFAYLEAHPVMEPASPEERQGLKTQLIGRITVRPEDAGYLAMYAPRG